MYRILKSETDMEKQRITDRIVFVSLEHCTPSLARIRIRIEGLYHVIWHGKIKKFNPAVRIRTVSRFHFSVYIRRRIQLLMQKLARCVFLRITWICIWRVEQIVWWVWGKLWSTPKLRFQVDASRCVCPNSGCNQRHVID